MRRSGAQYRSKLAAACTAASTATAKLPTQQRSEHLTITELRRRADRIQETFRSTVSSLRPPGSLRADQRQLLALGRRPEPAAPTCAQAVAAGEQVRAVYAKIGVAGCVTLVDRSLARLRTS